MFANKFEMREKLILRFRRTKCGLTIIMYSKALDVDNLDEFPQVTWSHFLPRDPITFTACMTTTKQNGP